MDVASLWIPVIIVSWALQRTELRRISDTPSLWHGVVCVLQVSKARERTVDSQALVSASFAYGRGLPRPETWTSARAGGHKAHPYGWRRIGNTRT